MMLISMTTALLGLWLEAGLKNCAQTRLPDRASAVASSHPSFETPRKRYGEDMTVEREHETEIERKGGKIEKKEKKQRMRGWGEEGRSGRRGSMGSEERQKTESVEETSVATLPSPCQV